MQLCFNLWFEALEISRSLISKQQLLGAGEGRECGAGASAGMDVWQELSALPELEMLGSEGLPGALLSMLSRRDRPGGCH